MHPALSAAPRPTGYAGARRAARDPIVFMIRAAALGVICIGLTALAGWIGDVPRLKSMIPGAVEMKANTAVGFIASGAALWLAACQQALPLQRMARALFFVVSLLGAATGAQYLFGWQLGIDEFLFLDRQGTYNAIRGRMSPYSAAAFVGVGLAMLISPHGSLKALCRVAATVPLLIGALSTLGYAWNASEVTTDNLLPPVAIHSAVAFVLLGAGLLAAIRQKIAQQASTVARLTPMEGKILAGFGISILLLAVAGGMIYRTTSTFTGMSKQVAHTQEVRAALGMLYGDITHAGLAQRNYLITGQTEQLAQYRRLASSLPRQIDAIEVLISDNAAQLRNFRPVAALVDRMLEVLDQTIITYQTRGFASAQQSLASGPGVDSMRSIAAVISHVDAQEQILLTQREKASGLFQRQMLASVFLTLLAATGLFSILFYQIRREILARQQSDSALLQAKDDAELAKRDADMANQAKSTFLATMSHEIRTPMNGVLGMLELLSLTRLDGAQHAALKVIRESGKTLMRIIDDILDFSKIEAQKLAIHPEPTHLANLVEDLQNTYSGNASSKGLAIRCHIDGDISLAVMVDPVRLRQILNNFLSNAIKFTSIGQIDIRVELVERHHDAQRLRFRVTDTGIGVSEAHQQSLFQPFAQAELNTARRYGGTGLGLSISRRLATLMGGSIAMRSEVGQGTTMTLELLLPAADPALLASSHPPPVATRSSLKEGAACRAAPTTARAEAEGTLVLLVDDHPTNRLVLMRQINLLGYAAESARDGTEALQMWGSGRFGLLLTDCNMPGMDGYALARAIRALEAASGEGHRSPIIACTANALSGEAAICLEAGMDDYITKPVELKSLLVKLTRWLPLPPSAASTVTMADNTSTVLTSSAAATSPPASCPIDHEVLAKMSAGDTSMERRVFTEFQRTNSDDVARLQCAVNERESSQVRQLAHLIKGSSAMVGAVSFSDICAQIEQANSDRDWNAVTAGMNNLQEELARLNRYFEKLRQPTPSPVGP